MKSDPYLTFENYKTKTKSWSETLKIFSKRHNLQPDVKQSALLIIDMINIFANSEGSAYISSSPVIINNILKLKAFFKQNNSPIIYTRHCHKNDSDLGMMGKFYKNFIKCETKDSLIIDELKPSINDLVITKNTYDSFHNTDLSLFLKENNINQLVITGVLTHLCCETTARSAFVKGYEVFIPIDALGSKSELLHVSSLITLTDGVSISLSTKDYLEIANN